MQEMIKKLKEQEEIMVQEKGQFILFALFLREDSSLGKWDLVVTADWIAKDKGSAIKYIADKVKSALSMDELRKLSHIAIIDKDNPILKDLRIGIGRAKGARITNCNFSGLQIKDAYLIEWEPQASY